MTNMEKKQALFFDRDGTLIQHEPYIRDPELVKLLPKVGETLCELQKDYLIFVVSNQSGVGRNIMSQDQFEGVHRRFEELLQEAGVQVTEFGYCLHTPEDACLCRKPATGLMDSLSKKFNVDLSMSAMIGDMECDIEMAYRAKTRGFLVLTGEGKKTLLKSPPFPFEAISDIGELLEQLSEVRELDDRGEVGKPSAPFGMDAKRV